MYTIYLRPLTSFLFVFLLIAVSVDSPQLLGQQGSSEKRKEAISEVPNVIDGIITINGKEMSFSTLDELHAITRKLQEATVKRGDRTQAIPNYFELKAENLEKTKAFYQSAFGFKFLDYGNEYAAVTSGSIGVGFATGKNPSVPLPAFQTFDIEASFKSVQEADGKIEKEIFQFPGGKRFEFSDPSGNRIAVFQND